MNLTCVAYKTYEKQWFSRKYTPWEATEKSEKVVLAPQRKVMKSLSPQGVVLLIKPIENNEFAPPQASCITKGVCIRRGV